VDIGELRACCIAAIKLEFVDAVLKMAIQCGGDILYAVFLACGPAIFQHHHFTPCQQGGAQKHHQKADIDDFNRVF